MLCLLNILLHPVPGLNLFSEKKQLRTWVLLERHSFHGANFCMRLWQALQTPAITGEVEELHALEREYCKSVMGGRSPLWVCGNFSSAGELQTVHNQGWQPFLSSTLLEQTNEDHSFIWTCSSTTGSTWTEKNARLFHLHVAEVLEAPEAGGCWAVCCRGYEKETDTFACNYSAFISQGFRADAEGPWAHTGGHSTLFYLLFTELLTGVSGIRETLREQILTATWNKATEWETWEREMLQVLWLLQASTSTL